MNSKRHRFSIAILVLAVLGTVGFMLEASSFVNRMKDYTLEVTSCQTAGCGTETMFSIIYRVACFAVAMFLLGVAVTFLYLKRLPLKLDNE